MPKQSYVRMPFIRYLADKVNRTNCSGHIPSFAQKIILSFALENGHEIVAEKRVAAFLMKMVLTCCISRVCAIFAQSPSSKVNKQREDDLGKNYLSILKGTLGAGHPSFVLTYIQDPHENMANRHSCRGAGKSVQIFVSTIWTFGCMLIRYSDKGRMDYANETWQKFYCKVETNIDVFERR